MTKSRRESKRQRPFPWQCGECGRDEVYPATIEYTTEMKHDGRLHRLTIPELRVPRCRSCEELVFTNAVHEQVSAALRAELVLLTPDQIRSRIRALHVPGDRSTRLRQKDLASLTGIASETISRWVNGLVIQSRAMDSFVRVFLEFECVREALAARHPGLGLGMLAVAEASAPPPRDVSRQRERLPHLPLDGGTTVRPVLIRQSRQIFALPNGTAA